MKIIRLAIVVLAISLLGAATVQGVDYVTSGAFTSNIASGSVAVGMTSGAYLAMNGIANTATGSIRYNGGTASIEVTGADFRVPGAGTDILSGRTVYAQAGIGVKAFAATTTGALWDFGGGVQAASDGTTLTFTSPIAATSAAVGTEKFPTYHSATQKAIETGSGAATAGALAVTFGTAFGAAPNCTCADTNAVPLPCGISTAANTTSVTFTATGGGTEVIQWICVGTK